MFRNVNNSCILSISMGSWAYIHSQMNIASPKSCPQIDPSRILKHSELPPELLDDIILEYVPGPDVGLQHRSLSALSCVSKALRRLTEPILYQRIYFTWDEVSDPPLHLLLRTILNRPELAYHIHHVFLDSWNMTIRENQARGIDASFNEEELELLKSRISRWPNMVGGVAWWMDTLLEGTPSASTIYFITAPSRAGQFCFIETHHI